MKTRGWGPMTHSGPTTVGEKATSTLHKKRLFGWVEHQARKALGPGAQAFKVDGAGVEPEFRFHVINKMDDGRMVGGHGRTQQDALAMAREAYLTWQSTPTKTETA